MGLKSTFVSVLVAFLAICIVGASSLNAQTRKIDNENLRIMEDAQRIRVDRTFRELDREVKKLEADKIDVLKPNFPPFYQNLPKTLLIGDFTLTVGRYTDRGRWNFADKRAEGVSGTAWLSFNCATIFVPIWPEFITVLSVLTPRAMEDRFEVKNRFLVVSAVTDPQNQISLENARMIKPDIGTGENLELRMLVKDNTSESILVAKDELIKNIEFWKKGDILVHFEDVTIAPVMGDTGKGRIIQGTASYPTEFPVPKIIKLSVAGFTAVIDVLTLTPNGATANITLQFPKNISSGIDCEPASVPLGTTAITPKCQFYVEKLSDAFGPLWLGNTGVNVSGNGFVADFSTTQSYGGATPSLANSWRGVYLLAGQTAPEPSGTVISNSGYLKGSYSFSDATVTYTGFKGTLQSTASYSFLPLHPFGYQVSFQSGTVQLDKNSVSGGSLTDSRIALPKTAITNAGFGEIMVTASTLTIQPDGDLFGEVKLEKEVFWGELTNTGSQLHAYSADDDSNGYFYLSYGYRTPYWPLDSSGFKKPALTPYDTQLDALGMQGVTFGRFQKFTIHTPDTPGSVPITFTGGMVGESWLNVVSRGVHGRFMVVEFTGTPIDLGPTHEGYYVGKVPFPTTLGISGKQRTFSIEYVESAVYDADISGSVYLAGPSNINLEFKEMQFTSTAHNAGGQVDLSTSQQLDYWGVSLVQQPDFSSAGLLCVKTGQIVLTAAGLSEPRHFEEPFWLIWGEMLASGDLGRLFFDYNTAGQTFDGFNFAPSTVRLSEYISGQDGYLQAGGTAHFDFFGSDYLNVHDYKYSNTSAPWDGRRIELGTDSGHGFSPTDTSIARNWSGAFGSTDFEIGYDSADQDGFIGSGQMGIEYILNGTMDASIVLSSSRICMSIWETERHDFTLGPVANFGSMASVWGCACIEDGQLKRLMLGAELETSGNANILLRSAAYGSLEYLITPSVSELTINGMMYISLIAGGDLEVTGRARFEVNKALGYVEGDIYGKFGSSSFMGGITAEGQVNWHLGTFGMDGYSSIQGKLAITIVGSFSMISGGIEGGFYVGVNAPKTEAWVLQHEHSRFRLDMSPMPDRLTGIYAYLEAHAGFNVFILSGGIDVYLGLGGFIFSVAPTELEVLVPAVVGLPYILGHVGVYIHGEILGGLVSAAGWGDFQVMGPYPFSFRGTVGLQGCVLWVLCASVDITVGVNSSRGFYVE